MNNKKLRNRSNLTTSEFLARASLVETRRRERPVKLRAFVNAIDELAATGEWISPAERIAHKVRRKLVGV